MNDMKKVQAFGPGVRVKVRGASRVKVVPDAVREAVGEKVKSIEARLEEFTYIEPENDPYPHQPWSELDEVIKHLVVINRDPKNMFTGISDGAGLGDNPGEDDPIGTIIDATFARNRDLDEAVQKNPDGYRSAVRFRAGVGDRRPVFRDGVIYFDNVDDYLMADGLKLSPDTELFAVVDMPEGTNGSLWGSTGFGQAAPFLENSESLVFGNPAPIRFEINGVEAHDVGDAYERAVGKRALIKVRIDMGNPVIWPDLILGGKNRIEWFLGLNIYGFAVYNRFDMGRSLTIPERRALFKILGA